MHSRTQQQKKTLLGGPYEKVQAVLHMVAVSFLVPSGCKQSNLVINHRRTAITILWCATCRAVIPLNSILRVVGHEGSSQCQPTVQPDIRQYWTGVERRHYGNAKYHQRATTKYRSKEH